MFAPKFAVVVRSRVQLASILDSIVVPQSMLCCVQYDSVMLLAVFCYRYRKERVQFAAESDEMIARDRAETVLS